MDAEFARVETHEHWPASVLLIPALVISGFAPSPCASCPCGASLRNLEMRVHQVDFRRQVKPHFVAENTCDLNECLGYRLYSSGNRPVASLAFDTVDLARVWAKEGHHSPTKRTGFLVRKIRDRP